MGCGCGLCLRISLSGPGLESRVDGFGVWLGFDSCSGFGSILAWVRVGLVRCLFASGAGWLGGCVGCGCGLWFRCSLGGLG